MSALRVGYLLKKFPRLSETFVLNEILGQEALGVQVHVFSRRPVDDEPTHPELASLRAQIEYLAPQNSLGPWLEMFGSSPENRELLERFGALVRDVSGLSHPRLPSLFAEALTVLARARDLELDHIHAHFATDSALVAMLVRALGGPSYSVTAHAKDIYRSTVDPRILARVVTHSAFTVTVCDANVRYLAEQLPPEAMARVRRLYNGIDLSSFRPARGDRDVAHILSVGRLVEKKGFPVLVDALACLRDRGVAFRATFVGEGDDRARIEARIAERSLGGHVQLTGALDQDGVRREMSRATVMCLPCVVGDDGNRDALPTTLLESLACGLPCVSTPVTGIPEILAHGRAGVLVPEHDPRATADALAALIADPAARVRLADAGLEHVRQHFDARSSARTLNGWFAGALEHVGAA